jgi:hypothetical protein
MPVMPEARRPYPRVLAVVPAFNEEESVGRTIEELTSVNPDVDVLVVDDGSGDHTARVARRAGAIVCQLPYNLGVGGAMRAGDYRARGPRRWAMRLLAVTLTRLAHHKLTDVTSGFRAANRRAIGIFADHYPAEYLGDTVESLVIAIRSGCTVRQVPVSMRIRAGGRASQTPGRAAIYLLRAVVALGLALVRRWPSTLENLSEEDL